MSVTVISPPKSVLTLEQAKRHLRVDHEDDDEYIADLIAVAVGWLDGPTGWLGRSLGMQTLEANFPACIEPEARSYPCPPFLGPVSETPSVDGQTIAVAWQAGYLPAVANDPDAPCAIPAPIRHAILLMIGHLYSNRDAVTASAAQPATLPLGVDALLAPFRVWRV